MYCVRFSCALLCYVTFRCAVMRCFGVMHWIVRYCGALRCVVLYYDAPCRGILSCSVQFCCVASCCHALPCFTDMEFFALYCVLGSTLCFVMLLRVACYFMLQLIVSTKNIHLPVSSCTLQLHLLRNFHLRKTPCESNRSNKAKILFQVIRIQLPERSAQETVLWDSIHASEQKRNPATKVPELQDFWPPLLGVK